MRRGILSITDCANDVQMETTRKLPVTIIMRRNRHDGASSVIHQHVVSNKDGDTLLVHGVNCPQPSENTGLLPRIFCALLRGLCGSLCTVSGHCFCRSFIARAPFRASSLRPRCRKFERSLVRGRTGSGSAKQGMLGRPDHEGRSKERIGTCRVNGELAIRHAITNGAEIDLCTMRATDPIALHSAHLFGPVNGVQVFDQAIAVSSDTHHPLAQ